MSTERTPAAFGDLRGRIDALRAPGELGEVGAQMDWNIEGDHMRSPELGLEKAKQGT